MLIFPLIRDFLPYLDFVGRHFCEDVIVSEHIPNGEHDCVWFKIISLAKPMLSHFKHFLIITLVTKLSARHTFQHHMCCIHATKLALVYKCFPDLHLPIDVIFSNIK